MYLNNCLNCTERHIYPGPRYHFQRAVLLKQNDVYLDLCLIFHIFMTFAFFFFMCNTLYPSLSSLMSVYKYVVES